MENGYKLSGKEIAKYSSVYVLVIIAISYLFYHSLIPAVPMMLFIGTYLKKVQHSQKLRRKEELKRQFLTAVQMVCTSLRAGYAVENAFRMAADQLQETYGEHAPITEAFHSIAVKLRLNVPIERLLLEFARAAEVEDIRQFAEVFAAARRIGGDLLAIMGNTITGIERKEETQRQIDTVLSGKRMEWHIMSAAPLAILGYVRLTSPVFLDSMYGSLVGRIVMTVCLAVYAGAYLWGNRILEIEI